MKLSVVIPTYNKKDNLIEGLNTLSRQSYKNFEVIVIDDGSSDGTKEAIRRREFPFKINYFFQNNKGPSSARNLGIKKARGEIIFFIDADIVCSENLLAEHIESHKKGDESLVVLGYMEWDPRIRLTPFRKYIGDYHLAYYRITNDNDVDWGFFYTGNISAYKSFLVKGGCFDECFPCAAYEDTEFSYRLHKLGMRIILNRKAIAYHNHIVDFKSYQNTMLRRGKAASFLVEKVPPLKYKANCQETKNLIRLFFKRIIFNDFVVPVITEIINFLDKLMIPLPKLFYSKIMEYHRVQGIKTGRDRGSS